MRALEDRAVALPDGAELRCVVARPDAAPSGLGVLVVPDDDGLDERARAAAHRLAAAGAVALAPDLARGGDPAAVPDRRAAADLERAAAALAALEGVLAGRVGALGLGAGGTRAFLLACTSDALAACACVHAPLVHAELSADRPTQPLELALNLGCPLLLLLGEDDPDVAAGAARAEEVLSHSAKDFDIVRYPRVGRGLLDDRRPDHDPGAAAAAWERAVAFLRSRTQDA